DFKTVPPHPLQLRADEWQLQTYALAAPDLLDARPGSVHLFLIDIRRGRQLRVDGGRAALRRAAGELLDCGLGIAAADFALAEEDRFSPGRLESEGLVGWVPARVVAPWPEP